MKKTFSETEILEMAITKELQSYQLYQSLANLTSHPEIKGLLQFLSNEEYQHLKDIELEAVKKGIVVKIGTNDENYDQQLDDEANGISLSQIQIVELAIKKETEAFHFYVDMVASAEDDSVRQMLYELAEEEVKHKMQYVELYQEITEDTDP